MKSSSVRIDKISQAILAEVVAQKHESKAAIIRKVLEGYRREIFFRKCSLAYTSLKSDTKSWKAELAEREMWDSFGQDDVKYR